MPAPIRITHIIVRLGTGGAEKSLYRLIRHTRDEMQHSVICFGSPTSIGRDIENLGVEVLWLDERRLGPFALWRAWQKLKSDPPQILQGWMYYGNLLASFFGRRLADGAPDGLKVVWNIRQSPADFGSEKWTTRSAMRLASKPSFAPDFVIYNSTAGEAAHEYLGYNAHPHRVITNGIDLDEFSPDQDARRAVRCAHKVGDVPWVGMVCRYHPLKGIADFLAAVQLLREQGTKARFVLAGTGMRADNNALAGLLSRQGLTTQDVMLLDEIAAPQKFLPALDVLVLASRREGTPNILLEAMACGVLTVATRVGDAARIVREEQRLVEAGDPASLAACIQSALNGEDDPHRVSAERMFLQENYETLQCMTAYRHCYEELIESRK